MESSLRELQICLHEIKLCACYAGCFFLNIRHFCLIMINCRVKMADLYVNFFLRL